MSESISSFLCYICYYFFSCYSLFSFLFSAKAESLCQLHYHLGKLLVGVVVAVDGIKEVLEACCAASALYNVYYAEVLYADGLREDVEVVRTELGKCQLVGIVVIILYELLYVGYGLHAHAPEYRQIVEG